MEVCLDAVGEGAAPEDTFISVRIGDAHKQTRYVPSRTHRFPSAACRESLGRIEIFKRVGTAIVHFDQSASETLDVEVPYKFPGMSKLAWRMTVKRSNRGVSFQEDAKHKKAKLIASQQYIEEHRLESTLADALEEILETKPSDPRSLLSRRILGRPNSRPNSRPSSTSMLDSVPESRMARLPQKDNYGSPPPSSPPKLQPRRAPSGTSLPPITREDLSSDAAKALRAAPPSLPPRTVEEDLSCEAASISKAAPPTSSGLQAQFEKPATQPSASAMQEAENEAAPEWEAEKLRNRANAAILGAADSGALDTRLQAEKLRNRAKATILEAADKGALDTCLRNVKKKHKDTKDMSKPVPTSAAVFQSFGDYYRQNLAPCSSLQSVHALFAKSASKSSSAPVPGKEAGRGVVDLRKKANAVLLEASKNGTLDAAFGQVKKSKGDIGAEEVRRQALQTLQQAEISGKLDQALANLKKTRGEAGAEDLRQQAKRTLLEAATSGELDEALADVKKSRAETGEDLRQQAKQTLLEAATSGELDEALADLKKSKGATANEDVRQQAKRILLEATSSGKLDEALADVKKSKGATANEDVRQQAKQILLEATSSGKLDEALAELKKPKGATATEDLRQQAKQALLEANSSGKLVEALAELKKPKGATDTEDLRQQAKQALLEANSSGKLVEALAELKKPKGASATETLRQKAKQAFLEANSSGKLGEALANLTAPKGETAAGSLRQQAKQVLLEATSSGKLDEALASLKKPKGAALDQFGDYYRHHFAFHPLDGFYRKFDKQACETPNALTQLEEIMGIEASSRSALQDALPELDELIVSPAGNLAMSMTLEDETARHPSLEEPVSPQAIARAEVQRKLAAARQALDALDAASEAQASISMRSLPSTSRSGAVNLGGTFSVTQQSAASPKLNATQRSAASVGLSVTQELRQMSTMEKRPPIHSRTSMVPLAGPLSYRLRVTILKATNLINADWLSLSDPYCVLDVNGTRRLQFRTRVIDDDLYPVWNEGFEFTYEPGDELDFSVWDRDFGKRDDFLGRASINSRFFWPDGLDDYLILRDVPGNTKKECRLYLRIEAVF